MEIMEETVNKRCQAVTAVAKELQAKAEARCAEIQKKLDGIAREHAREMKEMRSELESGMAGKDKALDAKCKELDALKRECAAQCKQLEAVSSSLRSELAVEFKARTKAEANLSAVEKSNAKMEKLLQKPVAAPAAPAPTVAPRQAPTPMEVAVSRRDGNGRIMALTIKPST
jgi:chromosome segregation ATPase